MWIIHETLVYIFHVTLAPSNMTSKYIHSWVDCDLIFELEPIDFNDFIKPVGVKCLEEEAHKTAIQTGMFF